MGISSSTSFKGMPVMGISNRTSLNVMRISHSASLSQIGFLRASTSVRCDVACATTPTADGAHEQLDLMQRAAKYADSHPGRLPSRHAAAAAAGRHAGA